MQLNAGNIGDAKRLHALCPEPLRNWEWHHLALGLDQSLQTLEGHADDVTSVAWSPDGMRVVSGSRDNTLRIWDATSGESLLTLEGHGDGVVSVAWSPDGACIVAASWGEALRIWDVASGESLRILKGHRGPVSSVAWSPDGSLIVSGSDDETLRIWDSAGYQPLNTDFVTRRDGETLRTQDSASEESFQVLIGHAGEVTSVSWSPDGTRIVSGSNDNTLRIWDVASGGNSQRMEGDEGHGLGEVAWSPDGTLGVSGSSRGTLHIWDAANGENLLTLERHASGVSSVAWSPDGTRIISGSWDYSPSSNQAKPARIIPYISPCQPWPPS